jgi:hypothetical protein
MAFEHNRLRAKSAPAGKKSDGGDRAGQEHQREKKARERSKSVLMVETCLCIIEAKNNAPHAHGHDMKMLTMAQIMQPVSGDHVNVARSMDFRVVFGAARR